MVQRSDSAGIDISATPETSHGVGCYRKLAFNRARVSAGLGTLRPALYCVSICVQT